MNEKTLRIVRILFAIPWLVFGVQHFMYADFVATLVPVFMPFKLFWAYFTGTAMIAAGISFIVNKAGSLAAMLLGLMLTMFVLLIHVPAVAGKTFAPDILTRPLQDIALACASFLLASTFVSGQEKPLIFKRAVQICRYLFALMLVAFGIQQFLNLDFLTAKIPVYLPLRIFWVYLTGLVMIGTGICVLINQKAKSAAMALGIFLLLINLLNHVYILANDLHNPILWTGAMLDLAITSGVFILAGAISTESKKSALIS